jgi:hypothetical protein
MFLMPTKALLSEWARWGRGPNLGLPSRSQPFGGHSVKTPLYSPTEAPERVLIVDRCVTQLEAHERSIVLRNFQSRWSIREFMAHYRWGRLRVHREIEQAICAVHVALNRD